MRVAISRLRSVATGSLSSRSLKATLPSLSLWPSSPLAIRAKQDVCTSPTYLQRREFTLPDLSKLSPFGSDSNAASSTGSDGIAYDSYHEVVQLPFAKDKLFKIVSDVEQYETFVPYCVASKVDARSEKTINGGDKEFLATLTIGYGSLREAYTSKVTITQNQNLVKAQAIPTPLFRKLETLWHFKEVSDSTTEVDFTVHYSFTNPFYSAFAKTAIEKMTGQMMDAFRTRAERV